VINLKHLATPAPTQIEAQTLEFNRNHSQLFFFVFMMGSSSMPGGVQPTDDTISGPPLASPSSMPWRASKGRHDLSQRQLVLLRETLITITVPSFFSINEFPDVSVKTGSVRPMPPHLVGSSLFPSGISKSSFSATGP